MEISDFSLSGKTALITGGGTGIGAALSAGLNDFGADVHVFEYKIPQSVPEGIRFYDVDVSDPEALKSGFDTFLEAASKIDILVNNAAVTLPAEAAEYPEEYWFKSLDTNLSAVFFLCQMAGRQMISQNTGGSIINVTSIGAHQGFPNNPGYGATKGGVSALTRALAYDWGKYNIRVNSLVPGYTHTPMNEKTWNDTELHKVRAERNLLGRWAEPEDIIGPLIFLASDASCYVTGSDLCVDGGWLSKGI
ncbi:MAG: SDR family oxidoreductase [Rhodospirillales bacterium]|nr:SDR family oxidoreductase [Rhodospirillales bacterium]